MTKWVIRDYFSAFRWGKVKEFYNNGGWFWILYMTVGLPLIWQISSSVIDWMDYYFAIVPIMLCMFGAPLHPVTLPKIMYLCPLSEAKRREYVRKSFWFKIAVPTGLSIFFMGILLVLKRTDISVAGMVVLETILLGLVLGIDAEGTINWGGKGFREPLIKELKTWQPVAGVVGVVMACFVAFLTVGERESWEMILIWSLILMLQLPLTVKIMTYYRRAVENAMNYESCGAK